MRQALWVAILVVLGLSGCGGDSTPAVSAPPNQAPDAAFAAALDAELKASTAANTFSGAVPVVRDGQTVFEGAYGLSDREQNLPNALLTQFRVGSMNKMSTAVAVLQLVQAGEVA